MCLVSLSFIDNGSLTLGSSLTVPLWELTRNLKWLSLYLHENDPPGGNDVIEEQDEAVLAAFELPRELPTSRRSIALLHYAIANRTIIAAARNTCLKTLNADDHLLEYPFAARTLL